MWGLKSFSKTVSTFDVASVPDPICFRGIGNPSAGQPTSAIKSCSAVVTGPSFDTIVRLGVLPPIGACTRSALVLYNDPLSLFAQTFFLHLLLSCDSKTLHFPVTKNTPNPNHTANCTRLSNVFNLTSFCLHLKVASFMPIKIVRAIQPWWAFSAIAQKDVAFTF